MGWRWKTRKPSSRFRRPKVTLGYEYRIAGAGLASVYEKYLVRFNDWSTVDFGRTVIEIENKVFHACLKESEWKDGALILRYGRRRKLCGMRKCRRIRWR
ncbi:MAG: hypothetical protein ACLRSW_03315 [Christensenellaceae bacterium]